MKRLITALLIILLGTSAVWATDPANYVRDYEDITVSTAAVGLTAAKVAKLDPALAKSGKQNVLVWVAVESAPVRFRFDGTSPTATVGVLLNTGDLLQLNDYYDVFNLRMIRDTTATGDAAVHVIYKVVR